MPPLDLSGCNVDPFAPVVTAWRAGAVVRHGLPSDGPDAAAVRASTAAGVAEARPPAGFRASRVRVAGEVAGVEVALDLAPGARVFGSGESFLSLDLRGRRRILVNRETHGAAGADLAYLNVPFFWSGAGWGLLLDTGAPVLADVGAGDPGVARFLVLADAVDVTTFAGPPASVLAQYTAHTGRVGDWPDWAFGTWMSRATYLSAAELHATLDELAAAACPVDVLHVDAWMTGNVFREFTCNWTVDRARFPAGWADALRARGARVSLWLNPFVLAGSPLGENLRRAGFLLTAADGRPAVTSDRDTRYLVDFTHPGAVAWWQGAVRRLLAEERPDALKLDFGEEVPPDAVCHDGRRGLALRNGYAVLYQRATAAAIPPRRRPFPLFSRSGGVGSQTTPCHWVGDTPSTWGGLAGALAACLSLSLTGFALVSHDAGGFYARKAQGRIPATLLDGGDAGGTAYTPDVDPELYGRWAQWAAFSPVTRFHGLGRREPTAYPEPWRDAVIAALRFRQERLRPVLRAAHQEAQQHGLPMMRPTALTHPHDAEARRAAHQYLLGADVLVGPVLGPGGRAGVWFPPDGEWVPVLGAPAPDGPGHQTVVVPPEAFPVYARRGSRLAP